MQFYIELRTSVADQLRHRDKRGTAIAFLDENGYEAITEHLNGILFSTIRTPLDADLRDIAFDWWADTFEGLEPKPLAPDASAVPFPENENAARYRRALEELADICRDYRADMETVREHYGVIG